MVSLGFLLRAALSHPGPIGIPYFLNKYVVLKAIPIPRLLYAFGVCLVSSRSEKRTSDALSDVCTVPGVTSQAA